MDQEPVRDEYLTILHGLEKHHALFSEFWSVGAIVEEPRCGTAAIEFDETGTGVRFLIAPKFWEGLDDVEKAFVICHECLHVYFEHGKRFRALAKGKKGAERMKIFRRGNKAGDVVINHYLEEVFGFDRSAMTFAPLTTTLPDGTVVKGVDALCWVDTVFKNDPTVQKGRSMEYYYAKLLENEQKQDKDPNGDQDGEGENQEGGGGSGGQTLDNHDSMNGDDESEDGENAEQREQNIKDFVDDLTRRITDQEFEDFEQKIGSNPDETRAAQAAGNIGGSMVKRIRLGRIPKKKKWETVIQDVLGRFKGKERDVDVTQWSRRPRRLEFVSPDLMLPNDITETIRIRDRIDVWFFQDTSGSCLSYAERFFKAAASIPEDRFKIRAFCFDTKVYEVDFKKGELKGFGGTAFSVIEEEIQRIVALEQCKYPQVVFLITDGDGNAVRPQHPERWHWFMTDGYSKHYIPPTSKTYLLKDFE